MNDSPSPSPLSRWLEPGATNILLIYILYLASIVFPIGGLVGVVIAYVNRGKTEGWVETHYVWVIRTFWIGLLYMIISFVLVFVLIGFVLLLATMVWFIVRCVTGIMAADRGEPVKNPQSWLI